MGKSACKIMLLYKSSSRTTPGIELMGSVWHSKAFYLDCCGCFAASQNKYDVSTISGLPEGLPIPDREIVHIKLQAYLCIQNHDDL